jgi:outer membrane immunogenic protein
MKKLLLAGVIAGSWSSCALAADLGPYRPPPAYEPAYEPVRDVRLDDWTGFYAGVNAGYGWGNDSAVTLSGPGTGGSFGALQPDGWFGGGQLGYNLQFDRLVLGVEADLQGADISDGTSGISGAYLAQSNVDINWFSTVRGRVGYSTGPALLYFTGGFAFADVDYSATATGPAGTIALSSDGIKTGYTLGGGLEWAFTPDWSLKTEYLYVDLGNETLSSPGGAFTSSTDTDFHTVRVGLNYHF